MIKSFVDVSRTGAVFQKSPWPPEALFQVPYLTFSLLDVIISICLCSIFNYGKQQYGRNSLS